MDSMRNIKTRGEILKDQPGETDKTTYTDTGWGSTMKDPFDTQLAAYQRVSLSTRPVISLCFESTRPAVPDPG